jgi:hypothetical protein
MGINGPEISVTFNKNGLVFVSDLTASLLPSFFSGIQVESLHLYLGIAFLVKEEKEKMAKPTMCLKSKVHGSKIHYLPLLRI